MSDESVRSFLACVEIGDAVTTKVSAVTADGTRAERNVAMEMQRVSSVIDFYERRLAHLPWRRISDQPQIDHLRDMIPRLRVLIAEGRREKVMRWYGFIQGALWMLGAFTVDELKDHSNPDVEPPQ